MKLHTAISHTIPILFFFFNDTATTEIYTLSLHDALPICARLGAYTRVRDQWPQARRADCRGLCDPARSEEHTSELQSRLHLVCRLLLEKKKAKDSTIVMPTKILIAVDVCIVMDACVCRKH